MRYDFVRTRYPTRRSAWFSLIAGIIGVTAIAIEVFFIRGVRESLMWILAVIYGGVAIVNAVKRLTPKRHDTKAPDEQSG